MDAGGTEANGAWHRYVGGKAKVGEGKKALSTVSHDGVRWLCGRNVWLHGWSSTRLQQHRERQTDGTGGGHRLLWGKLPVTALLVHHFSAQPNCSQFHLVTLLGPPRRTIAVTYSPHGMRWCLVACVSLLSIYCGLSCIQKNVGLALLFNIRKISSDCVWLHSVASIP